VFELLKGHMCLEVSAIATIDLGDHSHQGLIDPVLPRHQGIPGDISGDIMSHVWQLFLQAQVVVSEAGA
jgi:hypothetical protein